MSDTQVWGMVIAAGGAVLWFASNTGALRYLFVDDSGDRDAPDPDHPISDTDLAAPEGFKSYVKRTQSCAPHADAATLIGYMSAGLSEAQILRKEVNRMASLLKDGPSGEVPDEAV
jgi:hypothetical protein